MHEDTAQMSDVLMDRSRVRDPGSTIEVSRKSRYLSLRTGELA